MNRKLKKLFRLMKYALTQRKNFALYMIREEAQDHLKLFGRVGVEYTEDIQDLIYHIDSYIDLPRMLRMTTYEPYLKKGEKLDEYMYALESARAVERDYIFELMKRLPIGFEL